MNKKENTQDLDLEAILQEFGSTDEVEDKALSDADMAELAGEVGMSLEDFTTSVEVPQPIIPEVPESACMSSPWKRPSKPKTSLSL